MVLETLFSMRTKIEMDYLLLDADCGLCSRTGWFISRRLRDEKLTITELDSEQGQKIVSELPQKMKDADSLYLVRNGKPYMLSSAAIRTLLYLPIWWKIMYPIVWVIPLPIRNFAYKILARNRRRLFPLK